MSRAIEYDGEVIGEVLVNGSLFPDITGEVVLDICMYEKEKEEDSYIDNVSGSLFLSELLTY